VWGRERWCVIFKNSSYNWEEKGEGETKTNLVTGGAYTTITGKKGETLTAPNKLQISKALFFIFGEQSSTHQEVNWDP